MEKNTNSSIDTLSETLKINKSGATWSEENKKLIKKLESAYKVSAKQESDSNVSRFYALTIDKLKLLIDEHISCELLEESDIYTIPQTTEWIKGVVNVRGDVVPIIDLKNIVTGENQELNNKNKIIIINIENGPFGLYLDQLPTIISFDSDSELSDYSKLPLSIQPFVRFAYMQDEEIWAGIDYQSFIQSKTSYT